MIPWWIQEKINGIGWSQEFWGLCKKRPQGQTQQKTFIPSHRGIQPKWSTKRIKKQVADAKLVTELTILIGSVMSDHKMRQNFRDSLIH